VKITKRQLRRIIKESQWGNFTGGATPLDVPMRDSGPVPKDQLRKMAGIFMNDMGMSPEEVLAKPEFVEQGITDLSQLDESKMKITKRQLRRIIKEKRKLVVEYSEHQSYSDISDHLEDMQEMFDDVMIKYVDSNWLEDPAQDNGSLAKDLEALYEQINKMSHIFSQLAGHGRRLS
jgi:hypothetical protein